MEDVTHGLQLAGIFLSLPVPPAGLDSGALTRSHREQCSSIVPQEEPLFPPSNRRDGDREAELWVDFRPGMDVDFCAAPHHYCHV
jgi:hypothetical protein